MTLPRPALQRILTAVAAAWLVMATVLTLVVAAAIGVVTVDPQAAMVMAAGVLALGLGGLVIWWRRPGPAGPLLVVLALWLQLATWRGFPSGAIAAIGALVWLGGALVPAHLLLAHPDALLGRRWRAVVVVGCYVVPAMLAVVLVATADGHRVVTWEPYTRAAEAIDPASVDDLVLATRDELAKPFALLDAPAVASVADVAHQAWVGLGALATAVVLVRRYGRAGHALRRSIVAVTAAGMGWAAIQLLPRAAGSSPGTWIREEGMRFTAVGGALLILLPVLAVLVLGGTVLYVELVRPRLDRTAAGALALAVGGDPGERLQEALARSLDDPSLELRFRRAQGWVSIAGAPSSEPTTHTDRSVTLVQEDGEIVAALLHDAVLATDPGRVEVAVTLAGLALGNARLHALALARVDDVARSTAALATATDRARAELTVLLTDGPCRQLEALRQLALELPTDDPTDVGGSLRRLHDGLRSAVDQLRAIAHRAYAPTLDHGLAIALTELAHRAGRRVVVAGVDPGRFASATELTAYLAVATEASNDAGALSVDVARANGDLLLRLDGPLSAPDPMVVARVAALDGSLHDDPQGRTIALPLPDPPASTPD